MRQLRHIGRSWVRALVLIVLGSVLVVASTSRWAAPQSAVAEPSARVPMVVAATDLTAGRTLATSDVEVAEVDPSAAPPSRLTDLPAAAGRRLLVGLRRGDPVLVGMTAARAQPASGRRTIALRVSADGVSSAVAPGSAVEVVAAVDAQVSAGGRPEERVVAVATVVGVDAASSPAPAEGRAAAESPAPSPDGSLLVTLDCAAADALRILWARDFARTLRLIPRPAPSASPPAPVTAP